MRLIKPPRGEAGMRSRRRHAWLFRTAAIASLEIATPLSAATTDSGQSAQAQQYDAYGQVIVVTAPSLFHDLRPERKLDGQAIESYGVSTIDDLIAELRSELGDREDPVFIINGDRVFNLDDLSNYPVEVLQQLQVLPRGSAVRVGGSSSQRVFDLTLKRHVESVTATAATRSSTDIGWRSDRGEAILTRVKGSKRGNVSLRMRNENRIFESAAGIRQFEPIVPYAAGGNIIAYPDLSGEIDPLLSAEAGEVVTIVPVAAKDDPSLADLATGANSPLFTDLGQFRTLRPALRSYNFNATYTTPLTGWLSSTSTFRLDRSTNKSLRGLPEGLFVLAPDSVFSPFSKPVGIAVYGPHPLQSSYRNDSGEANLTLTAHLGRSWTAVLLARHERSTELTATEQPLSSEPIFLDSDVDPFDGALGGLIELTVDRARSRLRTTESQLTVTGSPFSLPAGDVSATIEGDLQWDSIHSDSSIVGESESFGRSEQSIRAALDIPITSGDGSFLPQIGELTASVDVGLSHYSDAGTANNSSFGLSWQPSGNLQVEGSIEQSTEPAPLDLLRGATSITPDVRIFDVLTGATAQITYITGPNPALKPEVTDTRRLSANLSLLPSLGLQLNAQYSDTKVRDFESSLPPMSAAVMLAFPDRFVRDSDGQLILVDSRPVNFAKHDQQLFQWGFSMSAPLGGNANLPSPPQGGPAAAGGTASAPATAMPQTRIQLTLSHSIVLKDEILIRFGTDGVDLLKGGSVGIGGGTVRHQVDGTAAITSGGTGVRLGLAWRGPSTLETRIDGTSDTLRFSPLFLVNLRLFVDAARIVPNAGWARGLRFALDAVNLTGDRQQVRSSAGQTPLPYQPAYRDALGRTIELEVRKVF